MRRKLLKKLVCVFGMLFITFPAWSAVPSNLLPEDVSLISTPVIADFEGDMILAKGGGGGGSQGGGGGGNQSGDNCLGDCPNDGEKLMIQEQIQQKNQMRIRNRIQGSDGEPNQEQTELQQNQQTRQRTGQDS
jgi:hypothetical protein